MRLKLVWIVQVLVLGMMPYSQCQLQQLLNTLRQNPSLLASLQGNPQLLSSLLASQTQQQQLTPVQVDQCSAVKKQNKLLRQMILSVTGGQDLGADFDILGLASEQDQRVIDPTETLLKQVVLQQPQISLTTVLITPTPSFTTSMTTTSYETTVTHTETSEVPIILRGAKVVTTILETNTQVVTATEIKTSSFLVTPEPTWEVQTVTITPSAPAIPQLLLNTANLPSLQLLPILEQKKTAPRKRNHQEAQVVEIPNGNEYKAAYGAYFADSAQRSSNRFGDVLRPARNPLFSQQQHDFDYYEDDFQGLSAQDRPVFLQSPFSKSKVFTLYFSGTAPGHFETKLTTLPVDAKGQPVLTRNKRDDEAIHPSKVEPILNTEPPAFFASTDNDSDTDLDIPLHSTSSDLALDLESSHPPVNSHTPLSSTVTKTVTSTVTLLQCSTQS